MTGSASTYDENAGLASEVGCPSGLEPVAASTENDRVINPASFVHYKDGNANLQLAVFGAKCAGCIKKIESAMLALPMMQEARLNLSTGRLSLQWRGDQFQPIEITKRLADLGYRTAPFDPEKMNAEDDSEGRSLLRALAVAGFAMANIMLLSVSVWSGGGEMGPGMRGLMHWISALIAIPASLYAGQPFFKSAYTALKNRHANMDVPISLAVLLALTMSIYEFANHGAHTYFDAAVMLLFFLLIGRYLDHKLRLRARATARDLLALQATTTNRLLENGDVEAVSAGSIAVGDKLLLSPGDRVPVDGIILDGESDVDMSLVNGESASSRAQKGMTLHAGVLNLSARLVIEARQTVDNSLIADLTRLIEAGEQSKSRYIRLADRAASLYVPIVHTVALVTFACWFWLLDAGLRVSVMNAVAVLIITCPCALGLAAPAVQVVATGRLFKSGVLVKSGDALERLAEVDTIIFDKTGTLTYGRPQIVNLSDISPENLHAAASLARISRHPLSRAIVAAAGSGRPAHDAVEQAGFGISGIIDGSEARLGRADWVGVPQDLQDENETRNVVWFRWSERAPQKFILADKPRADAASTINLLRDKRFKFEMLSGDRQAVAKNIAGELGIEEWRAEVTPVEKTHRLTELREAGVKVAMIGDGLNDAPSLALAHASLSPGSAADASQAAADFVYQGDNLAPIVEAVDVAKSARRRVLENFGFAAVYNLFAVPLAAFGMVTPLIAALAMSGSSMIVTLNALRLASRKDASLFEKEKVQLPL